MLHRLVQFIKQHKNTAFPVIAVFILLAVGIPVAAHMRGGSSSNSSLDGWRKWQDWDCKVKSTENKFGYVMAEYDIADQTPKINIVANVSTKETPEVYVDGTLVTPSKGDVDIHSYSNCNGAKHTYYELRISVPSTCAEKKLVLKNSIYNIEKDISNDSCKTKAQYDAEQKAKEEAEAQSKQAILDAEAQAKAEAEQEKLLAEQKTASDAAAKQKSIEDQATQSLLLEAEVTCLQYAERYFGVKDVNIHYDQSSIKKKNPNGSLFIKANISDSQGAFKPDKPLGVMECTTNATGMQVIDFLSY